MHYCHLLSLVAPTPSPTPPPSPSPPLSQLLFVTCLNSSSPFTVLTSPHFPGIRASSLLLPPPATPVRRPWRWICLQPEAILARVFDTLQRDRSASRSAAYSQTTTIDSTRKAQEFASWGSTSSAALPVASRPVSAQCRGPDPARRVCRCQSSKLGEHVHRQ